MPAGVVSLAMHSDQSCISLQQVTYYTHTGAISHLLEKITDPVNFMCQVWRQRQIGHNSYSYIEAMYFVFAGLQLEL